MSIRVKWNTVPGDGDFAYATVKGVRVAHIVRSGGEWSAFVTEPELIGAGSHTTPAEAKARVRELLSQKES